MPTRLSPIVLAIAVLSAAQTNASAALQIWDGGGTNNNWTNPTNWVGDVAPAPGDDLWFPTNAARLTPVDDLPSGTLINSLIFSGSLYTVDGNGIVLTAGIIATNGTGNMLNNAIALGASQTWTVNVGNENLYVLGPIDTMGNQLDFAVSNSSRAQITGIISGAGGLSTSGGGGALIYGNNTFTGPVQINSGSISIYHGNALGSAAVGTTVAAGATLSLNNNITVSEPLSLGGSLRVSSGSKTWTGPITLTSTNPVISVDIGGTFTINSVISGTNGFSKQAGGNLVLNGNNTYTGTTSVDAGMLLVNGTQPDSSIVLQSSLGGTGVVGSITVAGSFEKIINPGPINGVGILSCSNLTLSSTASYQPNLNGTVAGTGYDQLNVRGAISLNNAKLNPGVGFSPAPGATFLIVKNDGSDPVSGIFLGLTNGATFNAGGTLLSISYTGGDGNDITLTRVSPPVRFDAISFSNGQTQLRATGGLSGFTYQLQAASNLTAGVQWSNIGANTANASGIIVFNDTNAASFTTRFYRAVSP